MSNVLLQVRPVLGIGASIEAMVKPFNVFVTYNQLYIRPTSRIFCTHSASLSLSRSADVETTTTIPLSTHILGRVLARG